MSRSAVLGLALAVSLVSAPAPAQIDPGRLAGMEARSIGPAGMSGKVTAVEGGGPDPAVLYVGGAAGGIWKTVNAGATWTPVFDGQPALSIGAIAVFQANPAIVWAGTGEGDIH